jgi:hypothetical protein
MKSQRRRALILTSLLPAEAREDRVVLRTRLWRVVCSNSSDSLVVLIVGNNYRLYYHLLVETVIITDDLQGPRGSVLYYHLLKVVSRYNRESIVKLLDA